MKKSALFLFIVSVSTLLFPAAYAEQDVREIIRHCEYKNPGEDQRSLLTITLIDKDDNERENIYRRLWKNYHGQEGVLDKMVLFTEFPPDAKGTGFMRWGYKSSLDKMADQWLYLPHLRKVRRVSVRDPGDSFLGSDLTYGDIEDRDISDDEYKLLRHDEQDGGDIYTVEIRPKEQNSIYSKKISWYAKRSSWDDCVRVKTDYYDRQGNLLKKQRLTWQKVDDAWIWDRVTVENVQTNHKSIFTVTDVKVNIGLDDDIFTERALRKGL
ncbi:hypothetical protein Tel_02730 [Candidatus Tenderia electrophaga]|jgi:hypothetical protein|uniref:Uncharacterized protein TP-0789 domain-containing protein n=1 Tax=Candidatus Tenderia electrophaga TaxID=1748243 RepID=A0A0S2TAH0_9GAMM|nr:hypothetical protein Tel_02730 [Candidatus Tenderia electrophaga]